jgi:two-component system, NarL family, sensor histidine kinase UhpB
MLKLVIIDDDSNNLELFAEMLKKGFPGSTVIKALNGKEGINFAFSEKPDIILLDIFMPEMDGFETGKILASDEKTRFIPVIMLTAAINDRHTRIKAFKCGASSFLTKPISYEELIAQVIAMFRIKKSEDIIRHETDQLSSLVESRTNELESQLKKQKTVEKRLRLTLKKLKKSQITSHSLMEDLKEENEIRQKAESELRKNEEKFRVIFESVGSGLIYLTGRGIILDVNPAFETITGFKKESLVNNGIVCIAKKELTGSHNKELLVTISDSVKGKSASSVPLIINGKYLTVSSFFNKKKNIIVGVITDQTQQKEAETQKLSILNRQTALLGAIPDIIMELNNEKVYTWANESGYLFFGQDVVGKNADFYSEGTPRELEIILPGSEGIEKTLYIESWQQKIDGKKRLLAWRCKSLKDSNGKIIGTISSARDITDLKQKEIELESAKKKLEQLNIYLQEVREEERKIISRELHDDLGQVLTAIKIDVGLLGSDMQNIEKSKRRIESIKNLINESILTVRRLTSQLRPHILDDLGLVSAIEWYTKEFWERTKIEVNLRIDKKIELKQETEIVIFRILQESLTNIIKHSEAKQIWITYKKDNSFVILDIRDDGIGITPPSIKTRQSFGLLNMKERAKEIGGSLEIDSKQKKGTTIRLIIPEA